MTLDSKQIWAGVLFIVIGIAVYFQSLTYPLGDAQHMGPGYFPSRLAIVLILFGVCAIAQRLMHKRPDPIGQAQILPIVFLVIGICAFGLLIDSLGLIAAVFALVVACCYSRLRSRPLEVLVIAVVLALVTSVLFVNLLNLPLKIY